MGEEDNVAVNNHNGQRRFSGFDDKNEGKACKQQQETKLLCADLQPTDLERQK